MGSTLAWADEVPSVQSQLQAFEYGRAPDESYPQSDYVERGNSQWPRLKDQVSVTVKSDATFYTKPSSILSPHSDSAWWNLYSPEGECSPSWWSSRPTQGQLVFVSEDVIGVRLKDVAKACGGGFNDAVHDPDVIFIKPSDVVSVKSEDSETEAAVSAPRCLNCEDHGPVVPEAADIKGILNSMGESVRDKKQPNKSSEDLERYLACYPTKYYADYKKFYKKLFDLVPSTFVISYLPSGNDKTPSQVAAVVKPGDYRVTGDGRLPFLIHAKSNLLKCLALRETGWNRTDKSSTGAMGLLQQTEPDIEDIRCMLKGCAKSEVRTVTVNGQSVKKTFRYQLKPQKWAQEAWSHFFTKAKSQFTAEEWKALTTHPITGRPCSETMDVKERDAYCPVNSIAAAALDQIYFGLLVRRQSDRHKDSDLDFNELEQSQLDLFTGGTHNAGLGTALKDMKDNPNLSEWAWRLSRQPGLDQNRQNEVGNYVNYLNRCLASGNWQPPSPERSKDCSKVQLDPSVLSDSGAGR